MLDIKQETTKQITRFLANEITEKGKQKCTSLI